MRGLARALGLLLREGRLVHEQIRLMSGDRERLARRGVAGEHDLAALPHRSHHLLGRYAIDALPALQAAEVGPGPHPQLLRQARVELPRARLLDERIPEGCLAAVAHGDRGDRVAVALDALRGRQLDDAQLVRQTAIDDSHRPHQLYKPARPVHDQRLVAFAQREGLQHSRQPEPVIGVEVGDEHAVHVGQPNRAHELALGAFAAVEQHAVAAAADQDCGQPAARARHRATGTGEEDRQVHGSLR